jgi:hypothetical protein
MGLKSVLCRFYPKCDRQNCPFAHGFSELKCSYSNISFDHKEFIKLTDNRFCIPCDTVNYESLALLKQLAIDVLYSSYGHSTEILLGVTKNGCVDGIFIARYVVDIIYGRIINCIRHIKPMIKDDMYDVKFIDVKRDGKYTDYFVISILLNSKGLDNFNTKSKN